MTEKARNFREMAVRCLELAERADYALMIKLAASLHELASAIESRNPGDSYQRLDHDAENDVSITYH